MPIPGIAEYAVGTMAVGAGVGAASGMYNRENYMYDSELRFQRFMSARAFANAQVGQYREDIRGMTEMTSGKMDTIYTVCTLFMCIAAALSCAGRIGMHGAAPPAYICGLFTGHIFTAILYLTLAMWLALHGSLRAQCGMVSLLTRKVRLPIPSLVQLDQARNFGSGYEKQEWGDIFRVPMVPGLNVHPQEAPNAPDESSGDSDSENVGGAMTGSGSTKKGVNKKGATADAKKDVGKVKKGGKTKGVLGHDPRNHFGSTARPSVPSWVRDEQAIDKGVAPGGISGGKFMKDMHGQPEHFKLFAEAQEEWWPYDVYARICMLYGVLQFLFAMVYYCLGTAMSELRGFWICWSLPMIFIIAQVLILRLDIVGNRSQQMLPGLEWAGHLAPYCAVIAVTLDYRFTYNGGAVTMTWVFVFLCFLGHFLFQLRLLDLAWPYNTRSTDMEDEPGRAWWPHTWKLPPAFAKSLWVIAPPKKLEKGQHCLLNEITALSKTGGGSLATCRRRRGKSGSSYTLKQMKQQIKSLGGQLDYWYADHGARFQGAPAKLKESLDGVQDELNELNRDVDLLLKASQGSKKPGKASDEQKALTVTNAIISLDDRLAVIESDCNANGWGQKAEDTTETGAFNGQSPWKKFSDQRSNDLPWQLTRIAILTVAFIWIFMILGTALEIAMGTESLLKPPGEPPWIRDQKLRPWNSTWIHLSNGKMPSNYRLFAAAQANYDHSSDFEHVSHHMPLLSHTNNPSAGGAMSGATPAAHGAAHGAEPAAHGAEHDGHGARRLDDDQDRVTAALFDLAKVLPSLGWLSENLKTQDASKAFGPILAAGDRDIMTRSKFMSSPLPVVPAVWPSFFEPRHLACRPASEEPMTVALTARGFGGILKLGQVAPVKTFSLEGLGDSGPMVGVNWLKEGLHLVTKTGRIFQCPGHGPEEAGTWPCRAADDAPLPLTEGVHVTAAAIAEPSAESRLAALLFSDSPGVVVLFEAKGDKSSWSHIGQIHVPYHAHLGALPSRVRLGFDGTQLLMMMSDGEVHRHSTKGSAVFAKIHHAPPSEVSREWQAACSHSSAGGLLRLALRQSETEEGSMWMPELISSA